MLLVRWCFDLCLAVWFFHPIPPQVSKPRPLYLVAAAVCLVATFPIYIFIDVLDVNLSRAVYRVGLYTLYLYFSKHLDWKRCVYFALIGWLSFNLCTNSFLTPALRDFYFVSQVSHVTPGTVVLFLISFGVITLISRGIPFAHMTKLDNSRFIFILFLCAIQLYIKSTLHYISADRYTGPVELSSYIVILQILLGSSLVFFERYLHTQQVEQANRVAHMANSYRYENAVIKQQADASLRRVHHDIKNHLLVIQNLSHDNQRLDRYVGSILSQLGTYGRQVDTGNELLDGLISSKIGLAERQGVNLAAQVDFRPCNHLEDIDVCAIFGNLLDNAIEAASQVPDPEERSVFIKGASVAGQYVLTCRNYYSGQLKLSAGLPLSTKADPAHHGIGLSSVRASVTKYGGLLTLDASSPPCMMVQILLPLPS